MVASAAGVPRHRAPPPTAHDTRRLPAQAEEDARLAEEAAAKLALASPESAALSTLRQLLAAQRSPADVAAELKALDLTGPPAARTALLYEALFGDLGEGSKLASAVEAKQAYLAPHCRDAAGQLAQLLALEKLVTATLEGRVREAPLTVKALYDLDLVDEDLVLAWCAGPPACCVPRGFPPEKGDWVEVAGGGGAAQIARGVPGTRTLHQSRAGRPQASPAVSHARTRACDLAPPCLGAQAQAQGRGGRTGRSRRRRGRRPGCGAARGGLAGRGRVRGRKRGGVSGAHPVDRRRGLKSFLAGTVLYPLPKRGVWCVLDPHCDRGESHPFESDTGVWTVHVRLNHARETPTERQPLGQVGRDAFQGQHCEC